MQRVLIGVVMLAAAFCAPGGENSGQPESLKVYQTEELLRNGNFRQKQFSVDLPLFWMPTYNSTIPEKRSLYSLIDGVLTMKAPFDTWQANDITPEASTELILSFKAHVVAGSLRCTVRHSSSSLLNQVIPAGKDFATNVYTLKLDQKITSGALSVNFEVLGKQGEVKLSEVSLHPVPPQSSSQAKAIYLDAGAGKTVLRGIALADNHSYYELEAARYLQKYLLVGFGRYVDILIGARAACEKGQELILIGNDFIDSTVQAEIKAGGYAILSGSGNLRIGGKEDGAIQGAFAVLANLGMDFYTCQDFSKPSSDVIKFDARTVKNPVFGYRYITSFWTPVSSCALGESCVRLMEDAQYLGNWSCRSAHVLPVVIDPFFYFYDHPEYYALNSTLKCRTWQVSSVLITSNTPEIAITMYMQICYSNPEVQKIVTENLLKWFEACPEMNVCHVYFGDRYEQKSNWCQCENCRKFGVNDTDRWMKFVNIIARELKKKYPEKRIATGNYAETKVRPANEKPESNVIMMYIVSQDGWACKNHFDCVKNQDAGWVKNVDDWLKDYQPEPKWLTLYGPLQPGGIIHPWSEKMKYFAEHGVTAGVEAFAQGDQLRQYVLCKLAWDPYQNTDELVAKFSDFYYGPAAPYVKQYVDLIEKCDDKRAVHGKDLPPSLVDYEFLTKGEQLFGQAIALTADPKKNEALQRDRLEMLRLYVTNNNKGSGLRGAKLQEFAKTFAEFLKMSRDFKVKEPGWRASYRKFIQQATLIDIGDTEPWHASPVVQKILADPAGMITKEEKAYVPTPQGLDFKLELFCGSDGVSDYQYNGMPKTLRPFAKVLRRASSATASISALFDLEQVPAQAVVLELEGLDCEKPDRANLLVKINDKFVVHQCPSQFTKTDWTTIKIPVPAGILKVGGNSLAIANTTPDKKNEFVAEMGAVDGRDYTWGWFLISKAKLILPAQ